MKNQEHIDNFSPALKRILNQEIKLGNEIDETSRGWQDENAIIIVLKKPFINKYKLENIGYRNICDPHYWKAEYFDCSTSHLLACKF